MHATNYFLISFVPIILAQIVCRLYLIRHLDQPADFTGAPWYVRLSFNSGMIRLLVLRETVLMYFIGFTGFAVCFLSFVSNFYLGLVIALLMIMGCCIYYLAYSWMEKYNRWGTRKEETSQHHGTLFQQIKNDVFSLINTVFLIFLIAIITYSQLRVQVRQAGYEAGIKDGLEQLKKDSTQSTDSK